MNDKEKARNRRNQKENKLKKAKRIAKLNNVKDEWQDEWANKCRDNMKRCSCDMCRNKRSSGFYKGEEKKTIQERRFDNKNDRHLGFNV
jgi:hypothetical protein